MATTCQAVRVVADVTMHVPRNDSGDLDSGAEASSNESLPSGASRAST